MALRPALVLSLALALGLAAAPRPACAEGRATVTWTRIDVPPGDGAAALEKTLKKLLAQAARKANFGKAGKLSLSAKVVEFTSEKQGDVHRVTCTIVGRIPGGPSARSRISFGGDPADKAKLEKQVLTMVSNAVVTRLAELVRARRPAIAPAKQAEKDGDS